MKRRFVAARFVALFQRAEIRRLLRARQKRMVFDVQGAKK